MSLGKLQLIAIIVLFITLLLVGGKKLPELARGVGEAARELKDGFSGDSKKKDDEKEEPDKKS